MIARLFCRAALLGPMLLALAGCPGIDLPNSVDMKLQESEDQDLMLHNRSPTVVTLLMRGAPGSLDLDPGKSVEIRFRVLSIKSYTKIANEPYYDPTPVTATNHLEEIDGFGFLDTSTPAPTVHYRDASGHEHEVSIDLDNCDPAGAGKGWESAHWGKSQHSAEIPGVIAGVPQPVCPAP
jgi:hypothetical protein